MCFGTESPISRYALRITRNSDRTRASDRTMWTLKTPGLACQPCHTRLASSPSADEPRSDRKPARAKPLERIGGHTYSSGLYLETKSSRIRSRRSFFLDIPFYRTHRPGFWRTNGARWCKRPYSWSDRRDPNRGFAQQRSLFGCVQICVFRGWGAGEGAPFPCISNGEASRWSDFRFLADRGNCASAVRRDADEVFCQLPTMGAVRGVPRLRV